MCIRDRNNSVRTIEDDAKLDVWVFLKRNYTPNLNIRALHKLLGWKQWKLLCASKDYLKLSELRICVNPLFLFKSIGNDAEKTLEFHISFKIYCLLSEMLRLPFDLHATWRLKPQRLMQIKFLAFIKKLWCCVGGTVKHHESKFGFKYQTRWFALTKG